MALDRKTEIVPPHAAAIIDDANETAAAFFDSDIDPARARIERILDKLLDGGRWPLDDLARRYAVDEDGIEAADRHGRKAPKGGMILSQGLRQRTASRPISPDEEKST